MAGNAAVLPDPQAAYAKLFDEVHARVFFQKCAAAGYQPRSMEEAQWMLETTAKLRTVTESEQVKQAGAQDNPYFQMNQHLDSVLAAHGLGGPSVHDQEVAFQKVAGQLMADPEIYNSVLSLKCAEAEALNAEYLAQQQAGRR